MGDGSPCSQRQTVRARTPRRRRQLLFSARKNQSPNEFPSLKMGSMEKSCAFSFDPFACGKLWVGCLVARAEVLPG
jgi:hypothetical protein